MSRFLFRVLDTQLIHNAHPSLPHTHLLTAESRAHSLNSVTMTPPLLATKPNNAELGKHTHKPRVSTNEMSNPRMSNRFFVVAYLSIYSTHATPVPATY